MPSTQIRIVDETSKDSKFGEIVIKSPDLTDGYFNNILLRLRRVSMMVGFTLVILDLSMKMVSYILWEERSA